MDKPFTALRLKPSEVKQGELYVSLDLDAAGNVLLPSSAYSHYLVMSLNKRRRTVIVRENVLDEPVEKSFEEFGLSGTAHCVMDVDTALEVTTSIRGPLPRINRGYVHHRTPVILPGQQLIELATTP